MFGISPHAGKRVAVADIGSGSAGVAIVTLQKDLPARIESLHRTILPLEERTPAAVMAGIKNALAESAEKALHGMSKKGAVSAVYAVVRAPWMRSRTLCVSKHFSQEERITNERIATLGKEALASDTELNHEHLIEANIVRVELNGYATSAPIHKRAHVMTIYTLIAECEPRIKTIAEETLLKTFSLRPKLRSGTGALLAALRERSEHYPSYLVVDMTATATSIFVVRNGTPTHHVLVPEGVQTILKRLSGTKIMEETLSVMRMLSKGHCEGAACEEVQARMALSEQELIKIFGEAMVELAKTEQLPNALVLISEPAMADWLSEFFSRIDFTQFTKTAQPFAVGTLNADDIQNLVTAAQPTDDIELLIASAFVNSGMGD